MRRIAPPPREGVIPVDKHRVLGFAEYGDPTGRLVLWHHGTPGGRRQIPLSGRAAAKRLGVRLVLVERPGVGNSTDHRYQCIRDWAHDAAIVADELGHDEFAVVGLSGGGPYALACASQLKDRVTVAGLLGSVCPVVGPEASPGASILNLAIRFQGILDPLRSALGPVLWLAIQPLMPIALPALHAYASRMPKGDQKVFADPEMQAVFIDDIVTASRTRFGAIVHDAALFGRPWGFDVGDIDTQVFWWHGDADNIIPLAHAEHSAPLLQACELTIRPEESHLGGLAASDLVLETLMKAWS